MKLFWRKGIVLTLALGCFVTSIYGQLNVNKFEIGANLGLYVYQGDLTPSNAGSFKTQKPGISIYATRILSSSFSLRTNLALAKLKGDDARYPNPAFRQERNFSFTSPLIEISELIVWNPLRKNYLDRGLTPYLMAGLGVSILRIKRDWSRFNAEHFGSAPEILEGLSIDQQHSLPGGILVVPIGIGFRQYISPSLAINLEASYRFPFTDYLDGFSRAANPEKKDHYSSFGLGLIYKVGKKNRLNCPVVRN